MANGATRLLRADDSSTFSTSAGAGPILRLENLRVTFRTKHHGPIVAVDGVSLAVERGQILSVVGESGSGKSVLAKAVLGLLPTNADVSGRVVFDGEQISGLSERRMRKIRGDKIGLVLQDPSRSLDPTMTVGRQIGETLRVHRSLSRKRTRETVIELLREVRVHRPELRFDDYPHEFSGGMRQRAAIAMALACDPDLLIADEPTTALDTSTQAEIISLLRRLQRERGLAVLFISHDLALARDFGDEIVVMYSGRVLEKLPAARLDERRVPYTRDLLNASPRFAAKPRTPLAVIPGQPLSRRGTLVGCPFEARCSERLDICRAERPPMVEDQSGSHALWCWNPLDTANTSAI